MKIFDQRNLSFLFKLASHPHALGVPSIEDAQKPIVIPASAVLELLADARKDLNDRQTLNGLGGVIIEDIAELLPLKRLYYEGRIKTPLKSMTMPRKLAFVEAYLDKHRDTEFSFGPNGRLALMLWVGSCERDVALAYYKTPPAPPPVPTAMERLQARLYTSRVLQTLARPIL